GFTGRSSSGSRISYFALVGARTAGIAVTGVETGVAAILLFLRERWGASVGTSTNWTAPVSAETVLSTRMTGSKESGARLSGLPRRNAGMVALTVGPETRWTLRA